MMFGRKYKHKIDKLESEKHKLEVRIQELEKKNANLEGNQYNIPDPDYIEVYMFKLLMYISCEEFINMKSEKQAMLLQEFEYIKQTFNIINNFRNKREHIIAYRDSLELETLEIKLTKYHNIKEKTQEQENQYKHLLSIIPGMRSDSNFVYSFTNVEVASSVLGVSSVDIIKCLSGILKTAETFRFEYESEWKGSQPVNEKSIIKITNNWNEY